MKADLTELKHKEFIKLQNRLSELQKKLSKMPNVKLAKPYQRGWVIRYDVRSDIKKRKDYLAIKELIESGWSESFTNNVNVVRAIRQKKTQGLIKTKWSVDNISSYYPQRKYISESDFNKLTLPIAKYWVLDTTSELFTKHKRKRWFVVVPSFWLVVKVKPFMITHKKTKGGELESEYQHIRNRLYYSGEFQSFITNYGKSFPKVKERTRIKVQVKKFLKGDAEDIYNERIPQEYTY